MSGQRPGSERGPATLSGEDRRRSPRLTIRVAVTLHFLENGKKLRETAYTVSVNDEGALLVSARAIPAGAKLELIHNGTRERQPCHVTRNPAETPEGFYVPIEFERPAKGFWQISFPPATH